LQSGGYQKRNTHVTPADGPLFTVNLAMEEVTA